MYPFISIIKKKKKIKKEEIINLVLFEPLSGLFKTVILNTDGMEDHVTRSCD